VLTNPGAIWYYSTDNGRTWTALWQTSTAYTIASLGYDIKDTIFTSSFARVYRGSVPQPVVGPFTAANVPTTTGVEQVSNPEFTTDTTGWAVSNAAISRVDSTVDPGVNSGGADKWCLKVADQGTGAQGYFTLATPLGTWVQVTARFYSPSANTSNNVASLGTGTYGSNINTTVEDTWQQKTVAGLLGSALGQRVSLGCKSGTDNVDVVYGDSVSVLALTTASVFNLRSDSQQNGTFSANITMPVESSFCGIGHFDDATNPQNGWFAYHNKVQAGLVKLVGGNYITVISATTATYVAGAELRVTRVGNDFALYWNGAQVGATSAIAGLPTLTQFGAVRPDATHTVAVVTHYA
jgi:hypothetical protein